MQALTVSVQGGAESRDLARPFDPADLLPGLERLLTACRCAEDTGCGVWMFAIEILRLREDGLTDTLLRWLIVKGYVEHREETTLCGQPDRTFRDIGPLRFTAGSCFTLTAAGRAFAAHDSPLESTSQFDRDNSRPAPDDAATAVRTRLWTPARPHWDGLRKELCLDGRLIKRFRVQSPNQETILAAFEEEGWPAKIEDPLPPSPQLCPKRRLHDAIKNLNRHQHAQLLRFTGDGTGEGVLWEHRGSGASGHEFPNR